MSKHEFVLKDFLFFVLFKIIKFLFRIMPKSMAKVFLDGLSVLVRKFDGMHKHVPKANLDFVFGDRLSDDEKENIIQNSYKNLAYNLYEFVVNSSITPQELDKKVTINCEHHILSAIKENKSIIFISAHYGNWELLSKYFSRYKPISVVGRPLNNQYLNDELKQSRELDNCEILDRSGATRGLMKALKSGNNVGLVVDQHTAATKGGIDVMLFGKNALQTDVPARLALKFNAVLLPAFVVLKEFGKYEINIYPPIDINETSTIESLTQAQADAIEKQISNLPDLWMWQHKRFKENYPEIYKKV
ncbi:lipid A biosynthesis lauroyl acyltransferase [Arcobacter sp. FWKO B]|uniref:lipid A biosynthesis lauroyl acyltransferase n=1 Tax=Arcobacter sp. FWKO B TaxID=2593672 RepID=UPI0019073D1E|nr:lipid A biosynthesis lauroyl acyltransferase [Arcobacter sp. FWKO B]